MLGWTTRAPEPSEVKESKWEKKTPLHIFQCYVLRRSLGFFTVTGGIFFFPYSLQVTLSITALNLCYSTSMKCSDYRSFLFCISSKKDVRNLSLEDIFHFLLCTFACYEIFGRKSERSHIRGCICI